MLYLKMFTRLLFDSSSKFKEKVIEEKLMTDMYTEWENAYKYLTFYFMAETESPNELLKEVKSELENKDVNEEDFNRMKKVWIANLVRKSDDPESMVYDAFDDILYNNEIIPDKIDKIRALDFKELKNIIKKIDFSNISTVVMTPNK